MSPTYRPPLPDDSAVPPTDRLPTARVGAARPAVRHRAFMGVGVAIIVAAIGCGLVYIGWRTDDTGPNGPGPADEAAGRAPAALETSGPLGQSSPEGLLLHGQFVVAENGNYRTRLTQTGTVTAISTTNITVSSADGFVHSYVVNPHTVVRTSHGDGVAAAISVGEAATVQADETGDAATATSVFHGPTLDVTGRPPAGVPVR